MGHEDVSNDTSSKEVPMSESRGVVSGELVETPSERRKITSIFTITSMVLGVLVSFGAVVGVLGRAFYVTRGEFSEKVLSDTKQTTRMGETLDRLDRFMAKQEASLEKLSDAVQNIKVEIASKR